MVNFDHCIGLARTATTTPNISARIQAASSKHAMAASPAGKNQHSRLNPESEMVASWCGLAKAFLAKPKLCQGALEVIFLQLLTQLLNPHLSAFIYD